MRLGRHCRDGENACRRDHAKAECPVTHRGRAARGAAGVGSLRLSPPAAVCICASVPLHILHPSSGQPQPCSCFTYPVAAHLRGKFCLSCAQLFLKLHRDDKAQRRMKPTVVAKTSTNPSLRALLRDAPRASLGAAWRTIGRVCGLLQTASQTLSGRIVPTVAFAAHG